MSKDFRVTCHEHFLYTIVCYIPSLWWTQQRIAQWVSPAKYIASPGSKAHHVVLGDIKTRLNAASTNGACVLHRAGFVTCVINSKAGCSSVIIRFIMVILIAIDTILCFICSRNKCVDLAADNCCFMCGSNWHTDYCKFLMSFIKIGLPWNLLLIF